MENIDTLIDGQMQSLLKLGVLHERAIRDAMYKIAEEAAGLEFNHSGRGPWVQVFTGGQFFPFAPHPAEIDIEDIAHALSCMTRFNGHCNSFYSVAQHSVYVSKLLEHTEPLAAKFGLLHDASEAYIGDVCRPLKYSKNYAFYLRIEERIQNIIYRIFGLDVAYTPKLLKLADDTLLATEKRDIMKLQPAPWPTLPDPISLKIEPMLPVEAEALFMKRYEELFT